jgi:hypothetical protein
MPKYIITDGMNYEVLPQYQQSPWQDQYQTHAMLVHHWYHLQSLQQLLETCSSSLLRECVYPEAMIVPSPGTRLIEQSQSFNLTYIFNRWQIQQDVWFNDNISLFKNACWLVLL